MTSRWATHTDNAGRFYDQATDASRRSRTPGRGCGGGNVPEVIFPCPHCSSLSIGLCSGGDEITHEVYNQAFCTSCGVRGPRVFADEIAAIAAWNALPCSLRWKHEPPKLAGWYPWRSGKGQNMTMIQIHIFNGVCGFWDGNGVFKTDLNRGEWAGPIPAPIET